ncbi:MAG: hypothetical protein AAB069_01360, partial [Planctomycetota bacterium]
NKMQWKRRFDMGTHSAYNFYSFHVEFPPETRDKSGGWKCQASTVFLSIKRVWTDTSVTTHPILSYKGEVSKLAARQHNFRSILS